MTNDRSESVCTCSGRELTGASQYVAGGGMSSDAWRKDFSMHFKCSDGEAGLRIRGIALKQDPIGCVCVGMTRTLV